MDAFGRYYQKNPLALPLHAVNVHVDSTTGKGLQRSTFTVLRSRVHELLALLANVDFECLTIVATSYEVHDALHLLSLDGPLHPSGHSADSTDAVPFASMWNTEDGHISKLDKPRPYRAQLVMKVTQDKKELSGQPVQRNDVPNKVRAIVCKCDFEEIVIMPGNGDDGETLRGADQRVVRLADLFDQVDIDHSGEIVLEEMRIVLKEKGYSDDFVEHLFYHMDLNKDKKIKRAEFYQSLRFLPIEIFSSDLAQSDDQLMRYFDEFDADHSGSLSWPEFQAALLQRGMSEDFIKKYFADLDLDKSQQISRNEYARCIGLRWNKD